MSFLKRMKEKLMGGPKPEQEEIEKVEEQKEGLEEIEAEVPTLESPTEEVVHETSQEAPLETTTECIQPNQQDEVEETLPEVVEAQVEPETAEKPKRGFSAFSITEKFKSGLAKTRNSFTSKVNDLVARYRHVDEEFFEELEDLLLQADVGIETVMELTEKLRFEVQRKNIKDTEGIQELISEKLVEYSRRRINCYFVCWCKWCR